MQQIAATRRPGRPTERDGYVRFDRQNSTGDGRDGGIGGAIAQHFHARGATVAISGRQVDKLEALKADIGRALRGCAL